MARDENLPFDIGQTYFGGDTTVIDANVGSHLEGKEYLVEDYDYSTGTIGALASRSNRLRKVRIVRNKNASAVLPKTIARLKVDGTLPSQIIGQVDGLCTEYTHKGYPVDEFLGSAGCLQNDLCYVVVDGLAKVTTDTGGDTDFGIDALIVVGTTTAGKVIEADKTVTGANLVDMLRCAIGIATQAVNGTSTDFVVDVGAHRR